MGYLVVAIYTAAQIYQLALQAGWTGQDAINMTAIALAESGGNTSVVNSIGATGLWQIYNGKVQNGLTDPTWRANMQDPLQNARAAYAKWAAASKTQCGGYWPWASYDEGPCKYNGSDRNNSWRNFLAQATAAVGVGGGTTDTGQGGQGGGQDQQTSSDTDTALASGVALIQGASAGSSSAPSFLGNQALGTIFARLASPGFWWSAGFMVLAVVLILVGLLIYFHKQVEQAVGTVAKGAEVAAVA